MESKLVAVAVSQCHAPDFDGIDLHRVFANIFFFFVCCRHGWQQLSTRIACSFATTEVIIGGAAGLVLACFSCVEPLARGAPFRERALSGVLLPLYALFVGSSRAAPGVRAGGDADVVVRSCLGVARCYIACRSPPLGKCAHY